MKMTRSAERLGRTSVAGIPILIVAVFGSHTVWAQDKPTTATASAAVAPVALAAPAVDVEAAPESSMVRLLVGKSALVDVGSPIARVSLTSADIADALVTSPGQLLLHGKVPGTISMFVWSRSGAVRRYEVSVQRDTAKLAEQVKQLFPTEHIEVQSTGRNVILSGTVSNKDVIERVVNVAGSFVDKKEEVVTTLQVAAARPTNQVLLRVRFAEVSRTALTELGMSIFTSPTGIKNTVGRVTTQQFPAPNFSDLAWTKANGDFGGEVTSAEGKLNFSDFLNLFLLSEKYDLGTVIRAMQSRGLFQSLAEPNLVAESGKEASFLAGGEFPIPVAQGSGNSLAISVVFKEFGIRLNFTPTVTGDRVHLKVRPEVSTLDYGNAVQLQGFRIPALSTRRTETELELRDGQTFAIAGLMNNKMQSTLNKVPGIGDIPILGLLFKSKAAQKDQTELIVMITPEILRTDSPGVAPDLPRLQEPFLPALPQNRTLPAPPPAYGPRAGGRADTATPAPVAASPAPTPAPVPAPVAGPQAAVPAPAPVAAAAAPRIEERQAVERANADVARSQPKTSKELAKAERKQAEAARERAEALKEQAARDERANAAAAKVAAKQAEQDAKQRKAEQERQDKLAAEQAKRDSEAAEKAEKAAAKAAAVNQKQQEKLAREQAKVDAVTAKRDAEEAARQRAIAAAEAKLKAAEAAYQAQVSKESSR